MYNDLELNGRYLGTITEDFVRVADILKESSYQVRVRKFSDHPIFAISKTNIPIGSLLIGKKDININWNYYLSFLNEFVQRGLISKEAEPAFINTYKNPDEYCCLFVVDENFTNFVFVPYPED
jgi:hypothetical protein